MTDPLPGDLACRDLVELVTEYLEGALPPEQRDRFELHLAVCVGCSAYVRQLRATLRAAGRVARPPAREEARERLLKAFRAWRLWRGPV